MNYGKQLRQLIETAAAKKTSYRSEMSSRIE
jgi:hypothetical protein